MATNGNGHNGNGNGHKYGNGKAKASPQAKPNLSAQQVAAITAALILGQASQSELAEQFKCSQRTIARVASVLPDQESVKKLASKTNVIEDCLTRFLNASTEAAIRTIEFASQPEQLAKHTPEQRVNLYAAASERVQFLAAAAERAAARIQGQAQQGQLPPAEQCVEDESGAIDGEVA